MVKVRLYFRFTSSRGVVGRSANLPDEVANAPPLGLRRRPLSRIRQDSANILGDVLVLGQRAERSEIGRLVERRGFERGLNHGGLLDRPRRRARSERRHGRAGLKPETAGELAAGGGKRGL